jgi:hypothetical protein
MRTYDAPSLRTLEFRLLTMQPDLAGFPGARNLLFPGRLRLLQVCAQEGRHTREGLWSRISNGPTPSRSPCLIDRPPTPQEKKMLPERLIQFCPDLLRALRANAVSENRVGVFAYVRFQLVPIPSVVADLLA